MQVKHAKVYGHARTYSNEGKKRTYYAVCLLGTVRTFFTSSMAMVISPEKMHGVHGMFGDLCVCVLAAGMAPVRNAN